MPCWHTHINTCLTSGAHISVHHICLATVAHVGVGQQAAVKGRSGPTPADDVPLNGRQQNTAMGGGPVETWIGFNVDSAATHIRLISEVCLPLQQYLSSSI